MFLLTFCEKLSKNIGLPSNAQIVNLGSKARGHHGVRKDKSLLHFQYVLIQFHLVEESFP